jgi:hypothetical protein
MMPQLRIEFEGYEQIAQTMNTGDAAADFRVEFALSPPDAAAIPGCQCDVLLLRLFSSLFWRSPSRLGRRRFIVGARRLCWSSAWPETSFRGWWFLLRPSPLGSSETLQAGRRCPRGSLLKV